ncbi:MAG: peptidylprolyl isomerase [Chloroflexi bacterium]|nr:peptidylprolyl isomerase [Chloroflexota bacterium]
MGATVDTTLGTFHIEFERSAAPNAVANFDKLARQGFYDGVLFHRVVPGFVIQGGDPTGTGRGGPGYTFADELPGRDLDYAKYTVAMANAGPNTNGSQWFVCLSDLRGRLPKNYTIFGRVTEGTDVVDRIGQVRTGPGDRPAEDVKMTRVVVDDAPSA